MTGPADANDRPSDGDDFYVTRATMFAKLSAPDAALRGDAWTSFQTKYAPIIAGFARKLGVAIHELDDVVQEVTLQFFQSSATFKYDPKRGRFRGYLKTVTYRTIRDRFRPRGRPGAQPLDDVDPADPRVETEWNDVWDRERMALAIAAVGKQYGLNRTFQAFERLSVEGVDVDAVAIELGMTAETVYKSAQRIRGAVREQVRLMEEADG